MKTLSLRMQWLVLLIAVLLPFFVIRFYPKLHHDYDLRVFRRWGDAWRVDWRKVYVNCETCNYPFLGTFFSGGMMSFIDHGSDARVLNRFRYYLAVVDGLNILAIWFILSRLQVNRAPLWAGIIGLLPSSWVSSSVWGQIDGVGQFLILLFFILLIWFNSKNRTVRQTHLFFFAAGFLLALMLLTKQLIYFSMGALGLILLVNMIRVSENIRFFFVYALTSAVAFLLPLVFIDSILQLKSPYLSHIQYILATGSNHGDQISSLGLNIWTLFTKDFLGSSHSPLRIGSLSLAPLSPFSAGYILFAVLIIFLFMLFLRDSRRQNLADYKPFNTGQIITSLIFFSCINLAFNLTLTGTHERYLYHFYPFILMACLALQNHSRHFNSKVLAALLLGALYYGSYLFIYLSGEIRPTDQNTIRIAVIMHVSLFVYLLYSWVRNSTPQTSDLSIA